MHLLSSGMPVLQECSLIEVRKEWKNGCMKISTLFQVFDCPVYSTGMQNVFKSLWMLVVFIAQQFNTISVIGICAL